MPSERQVRRPPAHRMRFWLAWAAGSMVLWLLLTSRSDGAEMLVGAGAAILAATVVEAVRDRGAFVFRPRLGWLRHAVRIPVLIVGDTVTVFAALVRHATGRRRVRGGLAAVPFVHGADGDPEDGARRAMATAGVSVAPNTYVIGIDPDRDEMLVHQLVPDVPGLLRSVGRR